MCIHYRLVNINLDGGVSEVASTRRADEKATDG